MHEGRRCSGMYTFNNSSVRFPLSLCSLSVICNFVLVQSSIYFHIMFRVQELIMAFPSISEFYFFNAKPVQNFCCFSTPTPIGSICLVNTLFPYFLYLVPSIVLLSPPLSGIKNINKPPPPIFNVNCEFSYCLLSVIAATIVLSQNAKCL